MAKRNKFNLGYVGYICLAYLVLILTHAFLEDTVLIGVVYLVVVICGFLLYADRNKRWFRKRIKILETICAKASDSSITNEYLFVSFDSDNFFVQYRPETAEFVFSSYIYIIRPNQTEVWNKMVGDIKTLINKEAPDTKLQIKTEGQLGKGFDLIMAKEDAKKELLLSLAHLMVGIRKELPYSSVLFSNIYFKTNIFNAICYGEYNGERVARAITVSSDGDTKTANGNQDDLPEDFLRSNPQMSVILQYDLYAIETNMLISKEEFDLQWEKCKDLSQ